MRLRDLSTILPLTRGVHPSGLHKLDCINTVCSLLIGENLLCKGTFVYTKDCAMPWKKLCFLHAQLFHCLMRAVPCGNRKVELILLHITGHLTDAFC